ncbi:MAG: Mrp/NBP35 family ATP-binding protein [Spirochaetaceae bacterium]|nr:Mrp/NBP35 family ATP-binding protein [Spirochaetaceae bacterium]MDT8297598.1 Mrp/NBP35 family ATP-binding protein [Spirochaetaceae bacterium]
MSEITEERVMAALATVDDPDLHQDLVSLGFIENLTITGTDVVFTVMLTTPACPLKDTIRRDCETALRRDIPEISSISLEFGARVRGDKKLADKLDAPFRNVIAVGAGKGGVGKSTVAVNLAIALADSGAKVGILDADIYGPNIPSLLGVTEQPVQEGEKIVPVTMNGIEMISMGFLIPHDQALVWRGPMIHSAINQLVTQVAWSELDYLVVDLPPGTGDAQMSLAQQLPLTGAVVVTTPQIVSVSDTRRGIDAFRKLNVPVLGVVENMAGEIFGSGGGEAVAEEMGVAFLGRLPLDAAIARGGEAGRPILMEKTNGEAADALRDMTGRVASAISIQQATST